MVFRRRDRRPIMRTIAEFLYPRGGWTRAFHYVKHRVRRLPDSPERIARGIWAGVFASCTPFYTMHFVVAYLMGRVMHGNILAALMGTFFGNPLTYVPIGLSSLKVGHFLLGTKFEEGSHRSFAGKFADAANDLMFNFKTLFNDQMPDWAGLSVFYDEVFLPYMVGGLVTGAIAGTVAYYFSVSLIRAYQHRRIGRIRAKFEAIKKKAAAKADARRNAD
ncbi:MAG: DUF2062 domain-containing protein [Rhodobacteraceae bacterium]|nr:DUF2062 domain-containing protein [Paracoccaceae bacterium]